MPLLSAKILKSANFSFLYTDRKFLLKFRRKVTNLPSNGPYSEQVAILQHAVTLGDLYEIYSNITTFNSTHTISYLEKL